MYNLAALCPLLSKRPQAQYSNRGFFSSGPSTQHDIKHHAQIYLRIHSASKIFENLRELPWSLVKVAENVMLLWFKGSRGAQKNGESASLRAVWGDKEIDRVGCQG